MIRLMMCIVVTIGLQTSSHLAYFIKVWHFILVKQEWSLFCQLYMLISWCS